MSRSHKDLAKTILLLLLAGALTTSPGASRIVWKEILRLLFPTKKLPKPTTPAMVRRRFHYLKAARLISFSELPNGQIRIELTKRGEKRALAYKIEELKIKRPRYWDRKWRILIFDIPEKERLARDTLRNKLKDLGFLQLQKSVWIHPFPCEDEIDFMSQIFAIDRYILLATASLKDDRPLCDWFGVP